MYKCFLFFSFILFLPSLILAADTYPEVWAYDQGCYTISYAGTSDGNGAYSLDYLLPIVESGSCANQNVWLKGVVGNYVTGGNYNNYVSLAVYSANEGSFNPGSALAFWGQDIYNSYACDDVAKYIGYSISTFTNCDGYIWKTLTVYWAWFSPNLYLSRSIVGSDWSFKFVHEGLSGSCGNVTSSFSDIVPSGGRVAKYTVFDPYPWWPDQYNGLETVILSIPNEFNYNDLLDGVLKDDKYLFEYYHPDLFGRCVAVYTFNHMIIKATCSSSDTWRFALAYKDSSGSLKEASGTSTSTVWQLWSTPKVQAVNGNIASTLLKQWTTFPYTTLNKSELIDDSVIYESGGQTYQGTQFWYIVASYDGQTYVREIYGSSPPCSNVLSEGQGEKGFGDSSKGIGVGSMFNSWGGYEERIH